MARLQKQPKICPICGTAFIPLNKRNVVCKSEECKLAWANREQIKICARCKTNLTRWGKTLCDPCANESRFDSLDRPCQECGEQQSYSDVGNSRCQECRAKDGVCGTWWCNSCRERLPESAFTVSGLNAGSGRTSTRCRLCMRFKTIWSTYRLSRDRFSDLVSQQDEKCPICKKHIGSSPHDWHIDHDHACCPGRESCGLCIRGLLCGYCNAKILGGAQDDPIILIAAANYLLRHAGGLYVVGTRDDGTYFLEMKHNTLLAA